MTIKSKYKLTSDVGIIFMYVFSIIGIIILLFLIYSIVILAIPAIIFCIVIELVFYIKFFRLFFKFKNIVFDNKYLYFDDEFVSFNNIVEINIGKITYNMKDVKNTVYYNSYYGTNFKLLNEFHNQSKEKYKQNINDK